MSYYATGGGSCLLKKDIRKEQLCKVLDKFVKGTNISYDFFETCEGENIEIIHEYNPWHDEDMEGFLALLTPEIVQDGEVTFSGEDDSHWRYCFNPGTGEWTEENGEIVYTKSVPVPGKEQIEEAKRCLIDNGIEADEAETVLQALGYILLNRELLEAA